MNLGVIIVAAGSASRMKGIDKQMVPLQHLPVLYHSVLLFDQIEDVSSIVIVTRKDLINRIEAGLKEFSMQKNLRITEGGATRQESVLKGLAEIGDCDYLAIHDGARPLVEKEDVLRVLQDAVRYRGATLGVPVKDTIKLCDDSQTIVSTPPRNRLYQIQTPQIFETALYRKAVEEAGRAGKDYTDDCQLVESIGNPVHVTIGSYTNLKITTPEDLVIAEALSRKGSLQMRIGHGYDVHRLVENRKLILGGVEIPHTVGLLGHSDADVLLHAIMDALLGAAALGDIGQHFPDTDPAYAGADSLELLRHVIRILQENGYAVGNIDATILAQKPKLAPYIPEMRRKIAEACGIPVQNVSVKATTEEKLGFTGSCEGIAAHAVALIN